MVNKDILVLIVIISMISTYLFGQTDTVQLIKPTGPFPVGTITYEWTDVSREILYNSHKGDKRTIIVQMWYPAQSANSAIPAPYSSLSREYTQVFGNSYLRPSFTNKIDKSPLILISPGRGTERYLYTSLIEDLASHGFVVASVDMPMIGYTIYGDGLIVPPSNEFKTPSGMMAGPYEKVDAFYEKPTQIGTNDLKFAYQQISKLNTADPNNRFINKINLVKVGIFGHSLGGRIAGRFAADNLFVKAYISMEGIPPRDVRYEGKISFPSALLCSSGTWPYAVENYNSFIDNRKSKVYMIVMDEFGHNSVTDNPMIYPSNFNYEINPVVGLQITREIVTKYFQMQLQGKDDFAMGLEQLTQLKVKIYE